MKILFIHQNFPGQYRELFNWFAARGEHEVVFLTQNDYGAQVPGARVIRYAPHHRPAKDAYALSKYWEECTGHGFGAALACRKMAEEGFKPDIITGHAGWGELLFLKEVWPDVPIIGFFEYFYLAKGGLAGFDPEFPSNWQTPFLLHARNANKYVNLHTVDLGQTPTDWQRNTFPSDFHDKIYVQHDGIRTDLLLPNPDAAIPLNRLGRAVTRDDEIFTYMARNMEPVRGFHVFMRALPEIRSLRDLCGLTGWGASAGLPDVVVET